MKESEVIKYAHSLHAAHGDKAELEAAQKVRQFEEAGDTEQAEAWRAIRRAISDLRGPRES